MGNKHLTEFQTPPYICEYMASLIPVGVRSVLEPTKGVGNLLLHLSGYDVTAPDDYFAMEKQRFDCAVINPPFSSKFAFNVPPEFNKHGMRLGYHILTECMEMSDRVIALMPWLTLSDSDVRLRAVKSWGLISVTALPRKTFQYARIQTVVLELSKGFTGDTAFKVYDLLNLKTP